MTMAAAWSGESRLVNLLSNGTSVFLEWGWLTDALALRGAFPTKTINKLRKVLDSAPPIRDATGLPRRKESTEVIRKILAVGVAAIVALAIPAAASAKTLIGSGSVAAQPVFLALFHKYEQKHSNSPLRLHGGRWQCRGAGRSKRQEHVRWAGPVAAAERCRDHLHQDVPGRTVHGRQQRQQGVEHVRLQDPQHLPGAHDELEQHSGSQLNTTIDPVGRDTNGGTYNFFLQAVLNNNPPASNVNALTSDGLVVNAVKQDKNAIGYCGPCLAGQQHQEDQVNGVPCAPKQIKKFKYPLTRYIFTVVPTKHPDKDVLKWVDWARTSHAAGKIINKAGGVAAFNKGF